jgi:hypothetical protein
MPRLTFTWKTKFNHFKKKEDKTMSVNINTLVTLISSATASGGDVLSEGGLLYIKGTNPIPVSGAQSVSVLGSLYGLPKAYTITFSASPANVAANTTYSGSIQQVIDGRTYLSYFTYTTGASAPSNADAYAAIAARIQSYIDGGQLLASGPVTSNGSGVVFTGTNDAPIANISLSSTLDYTSSTKTLTAAASSATNASPRVFTAGAAHGLTLGKVYEVTFSGVTGVGAADVNRTLLGQVVNATDIWLLGTSNTGAVTTTSATITVSNSGDDLLTGVLGKVTGYNAANSYVGVLIQYLSNAGVEAGVVTNQYVLFDSTTGTAADVNSNVLEILTALSSVSSY